MNCVNCLTELKVNQTLYCGKGCKKAYKKKHRKTERSLSRLVDTGRGVFEHDGNASS
jgi:hypothetical protein